jgi:23S rRNA (uracil1939-C5)-methyltransferase
VNAAPTVELTVTGVVAGGDGIARLSSGQVVFVAGAAPGERVRAAVTEVRADYLRATLTDVLEPSADRVVAPCPHRAAGCGGCPWQAFTPEAQLRWKRDVVAESLRRIAHLGAVPVTVAGAVPPEHYRTTVRTAVGADGRPAYHRRRDAGLVAVDSCLVAHPALERMLRTSRFPGAREVVLRVSAATGEHTVLRKPGAAHRAHFLKERVGGRWWRVSAAAFFQSGPAAVALLQDTVSALIGDALPSGGTLVDAYAGVGVLGEAIASARRARLVAIESNRAAAADARANLVDVDATVVTGAVRAWSRAAGTPPVDVVIADPPRPGLGRPGVEALAGAEPGRLVLVSCDPASLARDVGLLAGCGYQLAEVRVLDLSPHTSHVEAAARFDRR